jgi:hypothetical protein
MHDTVCTTHCLRQTARIEKIPTDEGEIPMSACRRYEFRHPGTQIVITDNHLVIVQQPVYQIATDKSGRTRNKRGQANAARYRGDTSNGIVTD